MRRVCRWPGVSYEVRLFWGGEILVGVDDTPGARGVGVVVRNGFLGSLVDGILGIESVSVFIFCRADGCFVLHCIALHDRVVASVDLGVNAHTEEMLVVMCVDAWVDLSSPAECLFVGVHNVGVEDTRQFQLELNVSVGVE